MSVLPEGTVTFLFTDLERSTRLWEDHPEAMKDALARHDAILQRAVLEHDGHIVKSTGDGIHAAFDTAPHAVNAAVTAQLALQAESWGAAGALRVRMGLHTGESEHRSGDYYGSVVNRAARLMSAAHGGQILVSQATAALARDGLSPPGELLDLGELELRDLRRPEWVFQVVHPDLPREFPPLRPLQQLATCRYRSRRFSGANASSDSSRRRSRITASSCSRASVASERRGWRCKPPWTPHPVLPTARGGASWPALARGTQSPTSSRRASVSRPTDQFPHSTCSRTSSREAAAARARQLRAPPRGGGAPRARDRASLSACDGLGDEPRGARDRRRAHLVGAVARGGSPARCGTPSSSSARVRRTPSS